MIIKHLLILLFLTYSSNILGQVTGNVVFKISPPIGTSQVMIGDSTVITNSKLQKFPKGTYRIQIRAKYYEYVDTQITVIQDSTITFKAKLNKHPDLATYRSELNAYEKKVLIKQKLPNYLFYSSLVASVGVFSTTINNNKVIQLKERYDLLGPDPILIKAAKEEFEDQKQKVKRNRVISYVLLGTAISMKVLNIRNKKKKYKLL